VKNPAPVRLKIVGLVLLLVGALGITDGLSRTRDLSLLDPLEFLPFGVFPFLAGLGLIFDNPWAWALGLLVAGALVVVGVYVMAQPADLAYPAAGPISLLVLVAPGLLLLAAMLSPRSLRWVRERNVPPLEPEASGRVRSAGEDR